jgi:hypothetical protein
VEVEGESGLKRQRVSLALEADRLHRAAVRLIERWLVRRKFRLTVERVLSLASLRRRLVAELVETEASFVAGLDEMHDRFVVPQTAVLSAEEVETLFANVEEIRDLHRGTLAQLRHVTASGHPHPTEFNAILLTMARNLRAFAPYCNNFTASNRLAQRVFEEDSTARHAFASLAISPVQRVARLRLLAADYVKYSPPLEDDMTELQTVLEAFTASADYLNSARLAHECRDRVARLTARGTDKTVALFHDTGHRRAHAFRLVRIRKPVSCEWCESLVWTLSKTSLRCSDCDMFVHGRCAASVPQSCSVPGAWGGREEDRRREVARRPLRVPLRLLDAADRNEKPVIVVLFADALAVLVEDEDEVDTRHIFDFADVADVGQDGRAVTVHLNNRTDDSCVLTAPSVDEAAVFVRDAAAALATLRGERWSTSLASSLQSSVDQDFALVE